jgi:RHS repeat-associated protein
MATLIYDDLVTTGTAIVPVGPDGTITLLSTANVDILMHVVGYLEPATKTYTYTYAGDGLRRTKTAPDGTTTTFVWDRSQQIPQLLTEDINAPGTTNDKKIRYLYGPDGTVTQDITTTAGTDTGRWYHHDQLGSTIALTNTSGAVTATFSYTPYGTPSTTTGSGSTPIGWAGQYRDVESGLVYLRARYYDPTTGQFLTRDPLEVVTRSSYEFAGNNPTNNLDPTGMNWLSDRAGDVAGAIAGGVGAVGEFAANHRHTIIDVATSFATAAVCTGAFAACVVGFGFMTVAGTGVHLASDAVFDDEHNLSVGGAVLHSALSAGGGALCGMTFGRGCFGASTLGPKLPWVLPGLLGGRLWPALFMADMFVLKQAVLAVNDRIC